MRLSHFFIEAADFCGGRQPVHYYPGRGCLFYAAHRAISGNCATTISVTTSYPGASPMW